MGGPRGRHGWRGGRGVQRGQISRLVEPCLLAVLRERPRHGYDLITSLADYGFDRGLIDSGLVYRALRDMEAAGWVTSSWEMARTGPPRRIYTITEAGQESYELWQGELARTHDILHMLIDELKDNQPT